MTYKTILASMTLMLLLIPGAYASPVDECKVDVSHMINQIKKHSSVSTTDGYQINQILEPITASNDSCIAYGRSPGFQLPISWKVHKWSTTLRLLI